MKKKKTPEKVTFDFVADKERDVRAFENRYAACKTEEQRYNLLKVLCHRCN